MKKKNDVLDFFSPKNPLVPIKFCNVKEEEEEKEE